MADKSRERNYVDMFSDYGLDERQKLINAEIGIKCFKAAFYGVLGLTCIWLILFAGLEGVTVPFGYVALSYYILMSVCECMYALKTSKNGSINGITAFSMASRGSIVSMLMMTFLLFTRLLSIKKIDHVIICLFIMTLTAITNNIVLHYCGKRNFKVLDEDSTDDTKESEEE